MIPPPCPRCGLLHPAGTPCLALALPPADGSPLVPGAVLAGRYRIAETLARGGSSVVYLADDLAARGRHVALKELRPDPAATPEERAEAEAWFAREAGLLSNLLDPRIPACYGSFREAGRSYLAQEYVPGETLEALVRRCGPQSERAVRAWGRALSGLLCYLHSQPEPVVFRDLKPDNILLRPDGRLAVVDFGIARALPAGARKLPGTTIGTPGYAPPEQYQGLADERSDIYALGATLHRLLTGYDPEQGPPFTFPPVRDLNPRVSPGMAAVVARAVALDPAARYQSAEGLPGALEVLARRAARTRARIAALTGTLVVGTCLAIAPLLSPQRSAPATVWPAGAGAATSSAAPSWSLTPPSAVLPVGRRAATVSVTTCDESHLRSAISSAGAGGMVRFGCSGTITLAAPVAIDQKVTVDGSGQAVTISGGGSVGVFEIWRASLTVNHLTIANISGRDYGIQNFGTLRVTNSTFSLDSASGGGIENHGALTVISSTFSGDGTNGPGIENYGMLTITGSTFRLNSAEWPDIENFGKLSASNNTFSGDSANAYGGGIQDFGCVSRLPVCS